MMIPPFFFFFFLLIFPGQKDVVGAAVYAILVNYTISSMIHREVEGAESDAFKTIFESKD